ncbi:hypothetical protein BKA70DRAFT_1432242 [Coprinopsis sp. MPI-PUGE-AT-0042]|nr:hypothetical protein BKA70DRAFT_1432242 [Coprinopsis sp. MPI-PUGE-AT-0042]
MSMSMSNTQAPIIPVLDERLICPVDGEKEHRTKIDSYNELLESIYHRELELSKLKAGLVDMRHEIVEEAETLDTRGSLLVAHPVTEVTFADDASGDSESDAGMSEGSSASENGAAVREKKQRRGGKKAKGKGRGRSFGEEMGEYNVSPSRRRAVRRMSDAEDDD